MKRFAVLMLAVALALSGCMSISMTHVETAGDVVLPEREITQVPAPVGDSWADRYQRITLYYISSDRQQLVPLSRSVRLISDESAAEKALERLLENTGTISLLSVAPVGTRLEKLEISQHIATVSLSVDALALQAQPLLWMKTAVVNTLAGLEGIEYVNVLINGREECSTSLPTGTLRHTDDSLAALWAQQQLDEGRFAMGPASAQIARDFTLYFDAGDGSRLLPQVRSITLDDSNVAACLIEALKAGPDPKGTGEAGGAVLPAGLQMRTPPVVGMLEDGRRVAALYFKKDFREQLAAAGLSEGLAYEALTYTLCRALPQIDGLYVTIGGESVSEVEIAGRTEVFGDGIMSPANFDDAISRMATLYFGTEAGTLMSVEEPMDPSRARSPRALLNSLMRAPAEDGVTGLPVMPRGVGDADILGVRVEDRCAYVNLSSNFYRLCQGMTQTGERLLIYSMVNTLCELGEVDRVHFFIGGEVAETLAGWIYLKTELMPNPGLVEKPQAAEVAP